MDRPSGWGGGGGSSVAQVRRGSGGVAQVRLDDGTIISGQVNDLQVSYGCSPGLSLVRCKVEFVGEITAARGGGVVDNWPQPSPPPMPMPLPPLPPAPPPQPQAQQGRQRPRAPIIQFEDEGEVPL